MISLVFLSFKINFLWWKIYTHSSNRKGKKFYLSCTESWLGSNRWTSFSLWYRVTEGQRYYRNGGNIKSQLYLLRHATWSEHREIAAVTNVNLPSIPSDQQSGNGSGVAMITGQDTEALGSWTNSSYNQRILVAPVTLWFLLADIPCALQGQI